MTQYASPARQRLYRYRQVIRFQRILLAVLTFIVVLLLVIRSQPTTDMTSEAVYESQVLIASEALPTEDLAAESEPILIDLGEFKLTAYCPCEKCCGKKTTDPDYGITAYGYTATADHTIAVDPTEIPIGSEVVINGQTYIAEDVGGAIKGKRIDVFFESHQEALEFGVQYANVYINNNL
jgi:3D (Asp-Asp-Asp) domain-containing protein